MNQTWIYMYPHPDRVYLKPSTVLLTEVSQYFYYHFHLKLRKLRYSNIK